MKNNYKLILGVWVIIRIVFYAWVILIWLLPLLKILKVLKISWVTALLPIIIPIILLIITLLFILGYSLADILIDKMRYKRWTQKRQKKK